MRLALIGRAILGSRSPWLHEQEARAQGMALRYELIDFTDRGLGDDELGSVIAGLRKASYAGFNVTYPFKQQVIPLLDELAESAAVVGAVNTVAIRGDRLIGHNTDYSGFRQSMVERLDGVALGVVLQLGAGGAGAAVASSLLSLGVGRLDLADLDLPKAQALAGNLEDRFGRGRVTVRSPADRGTDDVDGIVNATPIGLLAHPGSPIEPSRIQPRHWVADIVYFPLETELLQNARARGCRTLDGSGMVVNQAAEAFGIITGATADRDRMHRSFFAEA